MIRKTAEKEKAITLRKEGKTYSDILRAIPVAKSTLGIWLKDAKLSIPEKQRFTLAKKLASLRGGQAKRKQRIEKQDSIISRANLEIKGISDRELFLIGVIMYWAEGAKEKEYHPGSQLQFSNMDPKMIQIFLIWLKKVCKIDKNMIIFNIFLHKTHKHRVEEIRQYWSKITGFPVNNFSTVYWKKNNIKTNRKNVGEKYNGVLKIKVKRSSDLVRRIAGWSEGIFEKVIKG
ncbi:hypothetical protein IT399_03585 [Candidatus Nomurabacteria bacterium]|nr:hypothetical protein [Candidatus Nomurabacteria bacterium]